MIWYCNCGCENFCNFGMRYISGHNNPMSNPDVKKKRGIVKPFLGKKHSEESKDKIRKSKIGKMTGNLNHMKKEKYRTLMKGDNNPAKRKEVKDKLRKIALERIKNGDLFYMNSYSIKNPSKPQLQLYNMVKIIDIFPILNYPEKETNFVIDIAIPLHKIAIEYDGSYWHQDEEKDAKRQEQLELLGWKFIRYRDYIPSLDELKKSIMEVHI